LCGLRLHLITLGEELVGKRPLIRHRASTLRATHSGLSVPNPVQPSASTNAKNVGCHSRKLRKRKAALILLQ
jgi:hypothetical protein